MDDSSDGPHDHMAALVRELRSRRASTEVETPRPPKLAAHPAAPAVKKRFLLTAKERKEAARRAPEAKLPAPICSICLDPVVKDRFPQPCVNPKCHSIFHRECVHPFPAQT